MDWRDRVVVVTGVGAVGQVGEAVARRFVEAGARVALISRSASDAEARAASLGGGDRVLGLAADLTNAAQTDSACAKVREHFGARVHALVCAAGGFAMSGPVGSMEMSQLERQVAINLTTAFNATRAFVPSLRGGGAIVYFASAAALPGHAAAKMAAYAASKAGVLALMRAVAAEEKEHGVRANALAPTSIRTATNVAAMGEEANYVEMDEVTAAVLYLASDDASAVTGQVLPLG